MKKKKGFIATSLIYSFFLVFLAIIAALISNYIANKTILLRYNEEALQELNTKKYSVTFFVYGAESNTTSQKGRTLTNLIHNGNFIDSEWWKTEGTIDFNPTSFSRNTARLSNVGAESYIYQEVDVRLVQNQKYYFKIDYSQNDSKPIRVFVDPNVSLITQNTNGLWASKSGVFYAEESTSDKPFVIGYSDIGYSNVYFTDAMLINLTEHFGAGNEPTASWLDENIGFFDGTINYLKEDSLEGNSEIELQMVSRSDYNKMVFVCNGQNDKWFGTDTNIESTLDFSDVRPVATLKVKNISDNIMCTVRWSNEEE